MYLLDNENAVGAFYDRPREKLISKGISALSDSELLRIVLNTGKSKETGAAKQLLDLLYQSNDIPSLQELSLVSGIGEAKACLLMAMLEFGRRRWSFAGTRISHPSDIY